MQNAKGTIIVYNREAKAELDYYLSMQEFNRSTPTPDSDDIFGNIISGINEAITPALIRSLQRNVEIARERLERAKTRLNNLER